MLVFLLLSPFISRLWRFTDAEQSAPQKMEEIVRAHYWGVYKLDNMLRSWYSTASGATASLSKLNIDAVQIKHKQRQSQQNVDHCESQRSSSRP